MNLFDWIVYAVVIGAVIGLTAWSVDGVLRVVGRPSRWIWLAAMTLSVGLPSVALVLDSSSVAISPASAQAPDDPLQSRIGPLASTAIVFRTASTLLGDAQVWLAHAVVRGGDALAAIPVDEASIKRAWGASSLALAFLLAVAFGRIWFAARGWKTSTLLGREVLISRDVGPAAVGMFRPRLVLPEWATNLDPRELALVLAHEEEHARVRDPMLLGLAWIPLVAMPWNPFLWWQLRCLASAVEVDCDRRVLRKGVNRRSYLALLLRLAARARRDRAPLPSVVPFASPLKTRMEAMIGHKRFARVGFPAALLVGLSIVAVACGPGVPEAIRQSAAPPAYDPIRVFRSLPALDFSTQVVGALERQEPVVALPEDLMVPASTIAEALRDGAPAVFLVGPGPFPVNARSCEYWWFGDRAGGEGIGQVVEARCVPPAGDGDVVFVAVPNTCVYSVPDSLITRPGFMQNGRCWRQRGPTRYDLVPFPGPP